MKYVKLEDMLGLMSALLTVDILGRDVDIVECRITSKQSILFMKLNPRRITDEVDTPPVSTTGDTDTD